jgi:4,5-DOPA dioxygenase extradiol
MHDLFGFGHRLQTFQYPAPGSPDVAREIRDVVKPRFVGLDHDARGLDHGTWSVMTHVFPDANVPIIQLSINGTRSQLGIGSTRSSPAPGGSPRNSTHARLMHG